MILDVDHWYHGYSQILEDARSSGNSVLVLCHADVDALAAARILTYMLRADNITYVLKPCPTFEALRESVATRSTTTTIYAAIVLLNVGGTKNLTKLFTQNTSTSNDDENDDDDDDDDETHVVSGGGLDWRKTKVYVMDGRRPLHLANIHADRHVIIFWDPTCHGDVEEIPSDGDNLSGNDDDDDDDSSSSSSSSSSSGTSEEELVDSDDDDDDDDDDGCGGENEMQFDNLKGTSNGDEGGTAMEMDAPTADATTTHGIDGEEDDDDDDDMDYDGEDEGDNTNDGRITPRKLHKKKSKKQRVGATTTTTTTTTTTGSPNTQATDATHDLDDDDDDDVDDSTPPGTAGTVPMTGTTANTDTSMVIPLEPLTPAQRHAQRLERIKLYYSHGNSYGSPCAFVTYKLASQLRFGGQPDLLWLGMIGVTDAYLQSRLDVVGYGSTASFLQDECRKMFPPPNSASAIEQRIEETVHAEELLVSNNNNSNNRRTRLTFSQQGRIVPQTDLRFFLLRHNSLWEALQLSPYVSTQFQLWTKPGMQRLQELLARMGYPLQECQQPYNFMKPSLRRQLYSKMGEFAEEFGLDELEFTSFVRVTGYSSLTSASDICYAASALLECPRVAGSHRATTNAASAESTQQEHLLQLEDWDLDCFHAAYDALGNQTASSNATAAVSGGRSAKTSANLQLGIQWAKKLQYLIITTAVSLVTRNAITRLRHFRYVYITCTSTTGAGGVGSEPNTTSRMMGQDNPQDNNNNNRSGNSNKSNSMAEQYHVLAKPLALTRLAHYLMDMHRANGKWIGEKQTRPLVLLAEQPVTGTYLVVGYEMAETAGQLQANKFGQYFELVASSFGTNSNTTNGDKNTEMGQAKAVARLESFDAHVVEVASTHVQHFLEQLHYIMDSM